MKKGHDKSRVRRRQATKPARSTPSKTPRKRLRSNYRFRSFDVYFRRRTKRDTQLRERFMVAHELLGLARTADTVRAVVALLGVFIGEWDAIEAGRHVRLLNAEMAQCRAKCEAARRAVPNPAELLRRVSAVLDNRLAAIVDRHLAAGRRPVHWATAERRALNLGLFMIELNGKSLGGFLLGLHGGDIDGRKKSEGEQEEVRS